jgi:hypothetical protein
MVDKEFSDCPFLLPFPSRSALLIKQEEIFFLKKQSGRNLLLPPPRARTWPALMAPHTHLADGRGPHVILPRTVLLKHPPPVGGPGTAVPAPDAATHPRRSRLPNSTPLPERRAGRCPRWRPTRSGGGRRRRRSAGATSATFAGTSTQTPTPAPSSAAPTGSTAERRRRRRLLWRKRKPSWRCRRATGRSAMRASRRCLVRALVYADFLLVLFGFYFIPVRDSDGNACACGCR